jgi:hypothetical protein
MKRSFILSTLLVLFLWRGLALSSGVTKTGSIRQQFLSNELTLQKSLSNELVIKKDDNSDLREDIYEFKTKSPAKAFLYSLIIPGAGQYYVGSKIKAASFLAGDIGLWTGYLVYHKKGNDGEAKYRAYADVHYFPYVYQSWWTNSVDSATQALYSHRLPWDYTNNVPIRNREYYENLGKYDQFQVGWDDIGIDHQPPYPGSHDSTRVGIVSPHRNTYLNMRAQANKYFSNAKTFAIVSVGNHLLSAFEAAIGAKRYNQGTKQYSLQFESREYNGKIVPYLVMAKSF